MTMQSISGSDFYDQVYWTHSEDFGATWADPEPITAFDWREIGCGYSEGVCDIVPDYHPHSGRVLALGYNVYYRDGRLANPQRFRFPVYSSGDGQGEWSERREFEWFHPDADRMYTSGCAERVIRDDGSVIIPISFGSSSRRDRAVTSVMCSFDGEQLVVRKVGNALRLPVRRGLLEPSLVCHEGRFLMTLRAEDGRGYHSVSDDGLHWAAIRAWRFDDGEELEMSTTQQHWLVHRGQLHLVYTRHDGVNTEVMRFRSPLYIAAVDPLAMTLARSSERVVIPLRGDPHLAPDDVPGMGNFHTLRVTEDESWVTVGEARPTADWSGDLLLARLR